MDKFPFFKALKKISPYYFLLHVCILISDRFQPSPGSHRDSACRVTQLGEIEESVKCRMYRAALVAYLPDDGGVDFLELGTMSPKLDDEFPPDLLE